MNTHPASSCSSSSRNAAFEQRPARTRKLPKRFTPVVFALYMSCIMALLMCAVIVGVNTGIDAGYPRRILHTYAIAWPAAFCCVLLVRPMVARLVAATVQP